MLKNVFNVFLICFLSGITSVAFANFDNGEQDDPKALNVTDVNGKKQGRWLFLGKHIPSKNYPENGKIKEGEYKDDRKEGVWVMYYKDGVTPKTKGNYSNNRPEGSFIKYWPNGTIKESGVFLKNKYQDSLKRYNEEGILIYEAIYNKEGFEQGKVSYYYDNGQPEFVYNSKNGTQSGKAYRYWPNGDVKEIIEYDESGAVNSSEVKEIVNADVTVKNVVKSGKKAPKPSSVEGFKPNAYNKVFNDDKEIWMEGDFRNGKLWDGRLYIYDKDGLLEKVEVYKEGVYHSDGQL